MSKEKNNLSVPLSEKITFGFGNLAANLMITTASGFLTYFYTDVVGIAAGVVGMILGIARLLDGLSDIAMGGIVDRYSTHKDKARPWIKRLAIPYGLALVLLFTSPSFLPEGMKTVWAFATYVIALAVVYTATMVPYNTMIGTTTSDQTQRSYLSTSRTLFGFLGAFFLNGAVLEIVKAFGDVKDAMSWTKMAALFGVISTVLLLILYKNSKERVLVPADQEGIDTKIEKLPFVTNLKLLFKNKYWVIIILNMLIGFIAAGFSSVNIYYAQYILGDISKVAQIGMLSFFPIMVGAFIVPFFISRFSKKTLLLAGNFLQLVGGLIMVFSGTNYPLLLAGLIIRQLGIAPGAIAGFAILGDISDYSEWKTGTRQDGLIFSAATFGEKAGSGIGAVIVGAAMAMGGYVANAASQSPSAIFAIEAIFLYIPLVLVVISTILVSFYNLDKEYPKILAELEERRSR